MQTSSSPNLSTQWVRSFMEMHANDSPILLAVSGGLDSMVMWDLVHKTGFAYAVAHVNYHLREEESDMDARLVVDIAKERGVELYVHNDRSLTKHSSGLQAHARDVRYQFFGGFTVKYPFVCTAHHADDQVETVLIQLGRGGGPKALAGISEASEGRLRPLLYFSKAELSAYAKTNDVAYRNDKTNASDDYLRNRVRHHLAPLAEKFFKGFRQNLVQAARQQQELLAFAASMVKQKLSTLKSEQWPHALDREKLVEMDGLAFFMHELLRKHDFASSTLTALVDAISDDVFQKRLFLNRHESICLVLTGQTLHLEQTAPFAPFEILLNQPGEYNSPLGSLTITECMSDERFGDNEIWLERFTELTWRTTLASDLISIASAQSKMAKRVLAEAKLPSLALKVSSSISKGKEVLWLVGIRKSAALKTSKAKTVGYRLRFTTSTERPGIVSF